LHKISFLKRPVISKIEETFYRGCNSSISLQSPRRNAGVCLLPRIMHYYFDFFPSMGYKKRTYQNPVTNNRSKKMGVTEEGFS
jgi:hypothetical protein